MKKTAHHASKPKISRGWFSRPTMADILGVSLSQFDQRFRNMAGASHQKKVGRILYIYSRGLIDSYVNDEVDKALRTAGSMGGQGLDPDEAGLLIGSGKDSPSLVRLRTVTAKLKELELEEKHGKLISRDSVHGGFGKLAAILRRAGEQIERNYGHEAHQILDDALDEAAREIELQFGNHDNNGNGKSNGQ